MRLHDAGALREHNAAGEGVDSGDGRCDDCAVVGGTGHTAHRAEGADMSEYEYAIPDDGEDVSLESVEQWDDVSYDLPYYRPDAVRDRAVSEELG